MSTARFTIDGHGFDLPPAGAAFEVQHGAAHYPVVRLAGDVASALRHHIASLSHPLLVIDQRVADLHQLADLGAPAIYVAAGEDLKSLDRMAGVMLALRDHGARRDTTVVVIGGGTVLDTAGLTAALYMRGVACVLVPTTLLAQADSALGGKTALNVGGIKNLIGLFTAPQALWVHPDFLRSLADADLRSGLGEVLRSALLAGPETLALYDQYIDAARAGDVTALAALQDMALRTKAAIVAADPLETGARRALNLGHSVAHGVESLSGYALPHGVCVAAGLGLEAQWAAALGLAPQGVAAQIAPRAQALITDAERTMIKALSASRLMDVMAHDKKADQTGLNLPVLLNPGRVETIRPPLTVHSQTLLQAAIDHL